MACIALRNFQIGSGPTFRAGDVVDGISWTNTAQLLHIGWIAEPPENVVKAPPKTGRKTWIEILVEEEAV